MIPVALSPTEKFMKKICTEYLTGSITRDTLAAYGRFLFSDSGFLQRQLSSIPDIWHDTRHNTFWTQPFLSSIPETLHFSAFEPQKSHHDADHSDRSESPDGRASHRSAGHAARHSGHPLLLMPHLRYSPAFFHSHDYCEIIYVASGQCLNLFPDTILELTADSILFLPPGQVHAISAFEDDCLVYNFLVQTDALLALFSMLPPLEALLPQSLADIRLRLTSGTVLQANTNAEFSLRVHHLWNDYRLLPPSMQAPFLSGGFQQLLVLLFQKYSETLRLIKLSSPAASREQLLSCIRKECATITLGEVAWRFGYTYEHVSRIVKKQTGSGFAELRRRCRMEKAADMLKNPAITVNEVMLACGYESRSSFFQSFKDTWNMTPGEYQTYSSPAASAHTL